jgi:hypothetical protein
MTDAVRARLIPLTHLPGENPGKPSEFGADFAAMLGLDRISPNSGGEPRAGAGRVSQSEVADQHPRPLSDMPSAAMQDRTAVPDPSATQMSLPAADLHFPEMLGLDRFGPNSGEETRAGAGRDSQSEVAGQHPRQPSDIPSAAMRDRTAVPDPSATQMSLPAADLHFADELNVSVSSSSQPVLSAPPSAHLQPHSVASVTVGLSSPVQRRGPGEAQALLLESVSPASPAPETNIGAVTLEMAGRPSVTRAAAFDALGPFGFMHAIAGENRQVKEPFSHASAALAATHFANVDAAPVHSGAGHTGSDGVAGADAGGPARVAATPHARSRMSAQSQTETRVTAPVGEAASDQSLAGSDTFEMQAESARQLGLTIALSVAQARRQSAIRLALVAVGADTDVHVVLPAAADAGDPDLAQQVEQALAEAGHSPGRVFINGRLSGRSAIKESS